jgi:hypothetical protein
LEERCFAGLPNRHGQCHERSMTPRFFALSALLALAACKAEEGPRSLVGDFAAPGTYALAGDTLTVWRRVPQAGGLSRFESFSITPGGTVERMDELERIDVPANPETTPDFAEHRESFTLPRPEFEAIRTQAALLRPASLGSSLPVGGYGGEVAAAGCTLDPAQPRAAGINFLNGGNWGAFVSQPGCDSASAKAAAEAMGAIFIRLERAAGTAKQ